MTTNRIEKQDNLLIRVADHEGTEKSSGYDVEHFTINLPQGFLEDARESAAGRLLLRILKAVDYAGAQTRPIMLTGRKQALQRGFVVSVSIPIPTPGKSNGDEMPDLSPNGGV